jgi:hypothetical protein
MYEPYYKCRGLACDKRVRVDGSLCQMCDDAFGWIYAHYRQVASWFLVVDSLYEPTEFAVTEREAVSLMKEYAV